MNKSFWLDNYNIKEFPKLETDLHIDVLIVGGGITGITCGLLLIEEGYKVAILDAGRLLHGTTGNTTAKVTLQHGTIYQKLEKKFDLDTARLYALSHQKAIDLIEKNISDFNIDCDYEKTISYVYTEKEQYIAKIEKEAEIAKLIGIDAFTTNVPGLPYNIKSAVGFKNQGHFHVTKYLHKLIEQFSRNDDSYIFENSKVIEVKEEDNFCHTFLDNGVKVKSQHVIIASHYPCNDLYNFYFAKLKPSMSYLMGVKSEILPANADFISYEDPIRTIRTTPYDNTRLLIIGGESHQTGRKLISSHYDIIEQFAKEHFRMKEVLYRWCTEDYKTFDNLPYIGKINNKAKNVYVATGFKKWGMATSHVAAMVLKDMITNGKSEFIDLYSPQRLSDKLTCKFFHYNLCSVGHFITDRLKSAEKGINVQNGEGKIVKINGKKYGAYRDNNGELYVVDVTCPHLKCILKFNKDELTYDCPCHGSRFTYTGKFIDGPALRDLKRIDFNK